MSETSCVACSWTSHDLEAPETCPSCGESVTYTIEGMSLSRILTQKRAMAFSEAIKAYVIEEYLKNRAPLKVICIMAKMKFKEAMYPPYAIEIIRGAGHELRPLRESRKIYWAYRNAKDKRSRTGQQLRISVESK